MAGVASARRGEGPMLDTANLNGSTAGQDWSDGGASQKKGLRKHKTLHKQRRRKKKNCEKLQCEHKIKEESEEVLPALEKAFLCSPWSAHAGAVLEALQPTERPCAGIGGSVRREEHQRGAVMDCVQTQFSLPVYCSGRWRSKVEHGKVVSGLAAFSCWLFVSHYLDLF